MWAISVTEASQVGEARRRTVQLAERAGLSEAETGKLAIAVSEAATNLLKHAAGGEVVLRSLETEEIKGVEVLALDKGPGMADVGQCRQDGYSNSGSAGTGLGAMFRLAGDFDIYSTPETGTCLVMRFLARKRAGAPPPLEMGAVCLPKPGLEVCGDNWALWQSPPRSLVLVVDGLGHGVLAAEASREAVQAFQEHVNLGPAELVQKLHLALRSTRGAALAVADINHGERQVRFAGVGNIGAVILTAAGRRNLVSMNGIVGYSVRKIQEFIYPWPADRDSHYPLLVMHSDGLSSHWSLDPYPALAARRPSLVAGVLYRDFRGQTDDVTVLAVRPTKPGTDGKAI